MNQAKRGETADVTGTVEELVGALNEVERKNAPSVLHCRGDTGLLKVAPRVSVVGSRNASAEGIRRTRKLSRLLISRGAVVVSGMAEGVDAAAHAEAMEVGGRTIAVLGSPLASPYPKSNIDLFHAIASRHLVISQFADGMPVTPKNFPMRNRTMALVSHATVIVEAAEKSGTLHQAWEALRLGRPLFILESTATNESLKWPKEVIGYGGQVLSDGRLDELFEQLPSGQVEEELAF